MKEYLVHIEIEDTNDLHKLIFHSSLLTVLFLAIDDFRKVICNVHESDDFIIAKTRTALQDLSENFEHQLSIVDEQDQLDEQEKTLPIVQNKKSAKDNSDDEQQDESNLYSRRRAEPNLKIPFPGAELVLGLI